MDIYVLKHKDNEVAVFDLSDNYVKNLIVIKNNKDLQRNTTVILRL